MKLGLKDIYENKIEGLIFGEGPSTPFKNEY